MKNKIDFVITWVDGNDEKWQRIKKKYTEKKDEIVDNSEQRYRDYGSLKYLLRSIEQYASWVRNIFLITDNQIPEWLNTHASKIKIVNHSEIIDNKYLPTFNSNSIEWNIYKIPGLTENFVYFNDDMLINRWVKPSDFFENNLPKDFKIYNNIVPQQNFDHILYSNLILMNNRFKNNKKKKLFNIKYGWQQIRTFLLLPQLFRGIPGYLDAHGPLSLKKSNFERVYNLWKEEIEETINHKFRRYNDVSIWLIRYFQLESGQFKPRKVNFNKYYEINEIDRIRKDLLKGKSHTLCINDVMDESFKENSKKITQVLEEKFNKKSEFER